MIRQREKEEIVVEKYRLILLDDEEIVTNGIQRVFNLEEYGFEIAAVFHNPQKALEQLESLAPDMIITDVKMPQMDGLEFSTRAKKILPDVEIVILSGYDDFSYAQAAIKVGIRDYLLKPIKKADFTAMLESMHQRIAGKKEEQSYYQSLQDFLQNNYEEVKNKFFLDLADGGAFDVVQYQGIVHREGVDFFAEPYVLVKIDIYGMPAEVDYMSAVGRLSAQFSAELSEFGSVEEFAADESLYFILCGIDELVLDEVSESVIGFVEAVRQDGITLTVGISQLHLGEAEFFDARNDCTRQIFMKEMHIDESSEANPVRHAEVNLVVPYSEIETLFRAISSGDTEGVRQAIEKLYTVEGASAHLLYREYGVTITFLILLRMCQMQNKYDASRHIVQAGLLDLGYLQKSHPTLEKQKQLVQQCSDKMIELVAGQEISEPSKMIVAALNYINQHFCENISLAEVAEKINISKNYLCDVFKKELGITFMNYVTNLRIEKAKTYLSNTDMKMYEVSDAVGYSDYAYFSQIFKKHTGTTLSAYRRQN